VDRAAVEPRDADCWRRGAMGPWGVEVRAVRAATVGRPKRLGGSTGYPTRPAQGGRVRWAGYQVRVGWAGRYRPSARKEVYRARSAASRKLSGMATFFAGPEKSGRPGRFSGGPRNTTSLPLLRVLQFKVARVEPCGVGPCPVVGWGGALSTRNAAEERAGGEEREAEKGRRPHPREPSPRARPKAAVPSQKETDVFVPPTVIRSRKTGARVSTSRSASARCA
jgi:hypothetical protein